MERCPECKAYVITGAKFCMNCGKELVPSPDWPHCTACFKLIDKSSKFCPWCGKKVEDSKPVLQDKQTEPKATYISSSYAEMVFVEGGNFIMGRGDNEHRVQLSSFNISNAPITQSQYEFIMKKNPSKIKGPNNPVECVNWCEAIIFCNKLSLVRKLKPCYSIGNATDLSDIDFTSPIWKHLVCDFAANGFRLPTEAEWEYAARGGRNSCDCFYAGSNILNEVGWYGENSEISSHEICSKKPNSLGIYDMCGNVAEWTYDEYGEYSRFPQVNPRGSSTLNGNHVKRGGSWLDDEEQCTIFFRSAVPRTGKSSSLGFRICSTSSQS